MNTPWFRFYSEVVDDPKVQRLPCEQFRMWVNVLCIANANTPRGVLPDLETIAFKLRSENREDLRNGLEAFVAQGLLDRREDGTLSPHNWEGRQQKKDTSAERMRRHREKRTAGGMAQFYAGQKFHQDEAPVCAYCLREGVKSVRHLVSTSQGGDDSEDNLAIICTACANKAQAGLLTPLQDLKQPEVIARFTRYLARRSDDVTRHMGVTCESPEEALKAPETPDVTRHMSVTCDAHVTPMLRSCYAHVTHIESESDSIDSIARSAALARDSEEVSTYHSVLEGWGYTHAQIQAAERVAGSRSNAPPKSAVSRFSRYLKTIMDDTPALAHHAATHGAAPPGGDDLQSKTAEMYRRRMKIQSKGEP